MRYQFFELVLYDIEKINFYLLFKLDYLRNHLIFFVEHY